MVLLLASSYYKTQWMLFVKTTSSAFSEVSYPTLCFGQLLYFTKKNNTLARIRLFTFKFNLSITVHVKLVIMYGGTEVNLERKLYFVPLYLVCQEIQL